MASSPTRLPLRLAFLGCGFATRLHSRTLAGFRGEVERFYASRSRERAEQYNRRFRGRGVFASYAEAISDSAIDIVLVATPPASHLELTLEALRAGKHVILEKPPLLRARDFDTVLQARNAAGRQVMVAENYFYKPITRALREVIASGSIGEPRILSVNALKHQQTGDWRDRPELAGGGALFEGGIHWINFMASLGLPVAAVQGFRPGSGAGPERSMVVVFRYAQGAVGTLFYSWEVSSPLKGLRLSAVYGTDGTATFESNGLFLLVRGKRWRLRAPQPRDLLGYRAMFTDFFRALRRGEEPDFDLAAARRDLARVEAVYHSLTTDALSTTEPC